MRNMVLFMFVGFPRSQVLEVPELDSAVIRAGFSSGLRYYMSREGFHGETLWWECRGEGWPRRVRGLAAFWLGFLARIGIHNEVRLQPWGDDPTVAATWSA